MRPRHPLAPLWEDGVLPFAALLVIVLAMLTGCDHSRPDITTANAVRLAGHEGAELLRVHCREPAEAAAELPPAQAMAEEAHLLRIGCGEAARAHVVLVSAHAVLHAASEARTAGECVGVSAGSAKCDVMGAASALVRAGADFGHAIAKVQREVAR